MHELRFAEEPLNPNNLLEILHMHGIHHFSFEITEIRCHPDHHRRRRYNLESRQTTGTANITHRSMQVEFEIDIGHPAVYMEQWLEIRINLIFIQVYNRKKYHYALPYWKHQTSD
jgi:hypothetical protein